MTAAEQAAQSRLGRIEAVIVSYDSGPELARACTAVLGEVGRLIVVDNGSPPALVTQLERLCLTHAPRMTLIANAENRGLAAAQNQGIETAMRDGADWVLLLDDDSLPRPGFIEAYARAMADTQEPERVGLLGAAILQPPEAGETRYWVMRGKWRAARRRLGRSVEENALFAIASGSLVRCAALRQVGGMREDFFIDYVDVELGLRLRSAGWKILIVPDAMLEHRLGDPTRHGLGPLAVKATNHGASRRFTIFRNRASLWRAYMGARPGWVAADILAAAADLVRIVCFEREKRSKLKAALFGLRAGLSRS